MGQQAAIGPIDVDELGYLVHRNPDERDAKGKLKPAKIFGVGAKFFYYQMLVGDAVDTVAGIKGKGPIFAYNLLKDATTERECYELVAEKYVQAWDDRWKEKLKQNAALIWMVRELDENGEKILWKPPPRLENVTSGSPVTPTLDTETSLTTVDDPSPV
jgi:5'-3' exonuclease